MINWKDAKKEIPPDGTNVAALKYHWKECWPLSAEILFGEVESYINDEGERIARVNTCDFTGEGCSFWDFPCYAMGSCDHIIAWALAKDFKKPDFINHDKHWGEEK